MDPILSCKLVGAEKFPLLESKMQQQQKANVMQHKVKPERSQALEGLTVLFLVWRGKSPISEG